MNTLVSREVRNSEVLLYLYSTLVCQRLLSVQKIYQMPTPANACTSMQFIAKIFLPTNATPTNACTSMQFIAKTFLPTNAHTSKCLHQHAIHCQNIFTNKCHTNKCLMQIMAVWNWWNGTVEWNGGMNFDP